MRCCRAALDGARRSAVEECLTAQAAAHRGFTAEEIREKFRVSNEVFLENFDKVEALKCGEGMEEVLSEIRIGPVPECAAVLLD